MPCAVCNRHKTRCQCELGYLPKPRKSLGNVELTCPWSCGVPVKRKDLEAHGSRRNSE